MIVEAQISPSTSFYLIWTETSFYNCIKEKTLRNKRSVFVDNDEICVYLTIYLKRFLSRMVEMVGIRNFDVDFPLDHLYKWTFLWTSVMIGVFKYFCCRLKSSQWYVQHFFSTKRSVMVQKSMMDCLDLYSEGNWGSTRLSPLFALYFKRLKVKLSCQIDIVSL